MPTLHTTFLWIARLEGVSLLVLFFVAMPLKYGAGFEHATVPPGWAHGGLFVAYVGVLGALALQQRWSVVQVALAFVAAFVPFGTFVFERRLAVEPA
jgi:integral membrane protein